MQVCVPVLSRTDNSGVAVGVAVCVPELMLLTLLLYQLADFGLRIDGMARQQAPSRQRRLRCCANPVVASKSAIIIILCHQKPGRKSCKAAS